MRGTSPIGSGTVSGPPGRERSAVLYCDSESGAFETKQQDVSGAATSWMPLSSMFIWSHRDCVFGLAHSASFEENRAQAESGTRLNPTRPNMIPRMIARLIEFQSTTQSFCMALSTARAISPHHMNQAQLVSFPASPSFLASLSALTTEDAVTCVT